jgi:uncharacterized protein (TIGR00290 family)
MALGEWWREADPSDVSALLALVQDAYRGAGGWTSEVGLIEGQRIGRDELLAEIASPATAVMVVPAERGPAGAGQKPVPSSGGLLACCVVRAGEAGIARFGLFAVDPARQASGVGRRLLAEARRLAADRFHADALEISVVSGQSALTAWYERLGFVATGSTIPFPDDPADRPLVAGLHFIVMRAPTRPVPYALSWSGGKDSALALHALTAGGEAPPVALITTVTADHGRISMHGVRRELLHRQAQAVGVELVEVAIPAAASNEIYERALAAALAEPPLNGLGELAFGDLFLRDVRAYRERQCAAAGRRARFPLWGRDTRALAERFIAVGFRARIVCLDPRRIPASLAGREFDERLLAELPEGVDPCGENGEFHTFVHDGPVFHAPVECRLGEVVERGGFVFADLVADV